MDALGGYGADIETLDDLAHELVAAIDKRVVACLNVTIDPIAYARGGK